MMNPFSTKSKKLARLKATRKKLPKTSRAFFVTLLAVVTMHFQTHLLEQTSVHGHAAHEAAFATGFLHADSVRF
jgi:hypothetical protein